MLNNMFVCITNYVMVSWCLGVQLTEKTSVEFAHNELYSFFLQLERVQQQLDALNT